MEKDLLPQELATKLRALPVLPPSRDLLTRVESAALATLAGQQSPQADKSVSGWRLYLHLFTFRAALPSALAGATILYLNWAIRAASELY